MKWSLQSVNRRTGENRSDILSTSLKNGMGADEFAEHFKDYAATEYPNLADWVSRIVAMG